VTSDEATVSIRELAKNTSRVVRGVAESGRPRVITNHGRPVVVLVPIDPGILTSAVAASMEDLDLLADEALHDLVSGRARLVADD
jgi:prevent-host-death family protein